MTMTNHRIGHLLETWTSFLLFFKGYRLLDKNFTVGRGTGAGEIDLIFKHGKTIIFTEVKKRASQSRAKYAIDGKNQMRIIKSSTVWMARHPKYTGYNMRFDAVVYDQKFIPTHIKHAWRVL